MPRLTPRCQASFTGEGGDNGNTYSLDRGGRDDRRDRDHHRFGHRAGDPAAQPGPGLVGGLAARRAGWDVPGTDRARSIGARALPAPAASFSRLLTRVCQLAGKPVGNPELAGRPEEGGGTPAMPVRIGTSG